MGSVTFKGSYHCFQQMKTTLVAKLNTKLASIETETSVTLGTVPAADIMIGRQLIHRFPSVIIFSDGVFPYHRGRGEYVYEIFVMPWVMSKDRSFEGVENLMALYERAIHEVVAENRQLGSTSISDTRLVESRKDTSDNKKNQSVGAAVMSFAVRIQEIC